MLKNEKIKSFFELTPIFFAEKCTNSQNFAYFCSGMVDLLLSDTLLVKISNHRKYPHFQLFILSLFYQIRYSLNFIHISTDSNFVLIS